MLYKILKYGSSWLYKVFVYNVSHIYNTHVIFFSRYKLIDNSHLAVNSRRLSLVISVQ